MQEGLLSRRPSLGHIFTTCGIYSSVASCADVLSKHVIAVSTHACNLDGTWLCCCL